MERSPEISRADYKKMHVGFDRTKSLSVGTKHRKPESAAASTLATLKNTIQSVSATVVSHVSLSDTTSIFQTVDGQEPWTKQGDTPNTAKPPSSSSAHSGRKMMDYTVKTGDTLNSLAAKFGTTPTELCSINKLFSRTIFIGQTINVPETPGGRAALADTQGTTSGESAAAGQQRNVVMEYEVVAGDTVINLAARFGITHTELCTLNRLLSKTLFVGQTLLIPQPSTKLVAPDVPPSDSSASSVRADQSSASTSVRSPGVTRLGLGIRERPSSYPSGVDFRGFNSASDSPGPRDDDVFQMNPSSSAAPGHISASSQALPLQTSPPQRGGSDPGFHTREPVPTSVMVAQIAAQAAAAVRARQEAELAAHNAAEERDPQARQYVKVECKYITDVEGTVTGMLLITPNTFMFSPWCNDPVVAEYGDDHYVVQLPISQVRSISMYNDPSVMFFTRGIRNECCVKHLIQAACSPNLSPVHQKVAVTATTDPASDDKIQPTTADQDHDGQQEVTATMKQDQPESSVAPTVSQEVQSGQDTEKQAEKSSEVPTGTRGLRFHTDIHLIVPSDEGPQPETSNRVSRRTISLLEPLVDEGSDQQKRSVSMEFVNAVSDAERPIMTQSAVTISKKAVFNQQLPVYLCVLAPPMYKAIKHGAITPDEYWFMIPRNEAVGLCDFLLSSGVPDYGGSVDPASWSGPVPSTPSSSILPVPSAAVALANAVVAGVTGSSPVASEEASGVAGSFVMIPNDFEQRAATLHGGKCSTSDRAKLMMLRQQSMDWELISRDEIERSFFQILDAEPENLPLPEMVGSSQILDDSKIRDLMLNLLPEAEGCNWVLLYGTAVHGCSLRTLYRQCRDSTKPCLILIKDSSSTIFGAMLSCHPHMSLDRFYGNGSCYVFRWQDSFEKYTWTKANNFFVKGDVTSLTIGCSDGHSSIWLDDILLHGRSQSCATFGSPPLVQGEDFIVHSLEVWSFA